MLESIKKHAKTFDSVKDLDPLLEAIGDAKYVLLGESSHGTSEFYSLRAELSKRLINEKGFSFLAVEGDWPACNRVNRYIKGLNDTSSDIREVLESFNRWPTWMWANEEIIGLIEWMKDYNLQNKRNQRVGFYGLDVYSLWESMDEIIHYLENTGSTSLIEAKKAFSCFEPFNRNHETYAVNAGYLSDDCMREAMKLLESIRKNKWKFKDQEENGLNMEVNALVAANAEEYYRTMVKNDSKSWNVRDMHMVEALNSVMRFYGDGSKAIIWEHNTHVGDARATDMKEDGMVNVGQLIREQNHPDDVYIIGFGTNSGTVISSTEWGADMQVANIPPAQYGSWEYLMHNSGAHNKYLIFNDTNRSEFSVTIGHRAIGVVYRPEYEHFGNYVSSNMSLRYDGFIYVDNTSALHPLILDKISI